MPLSVRVAPVRSEEHTSELQSRENLVCRLLLEKKKFHIDLLHFPLIRPSSERTVTTLHGRLDLPDLIPFYEAFPEVPLVSISNAQRRPMPPVNWAGTVYHGIPRSLLPFKRGTGEYLAFLG